MHHTVFFLTNPAHIDDPVAVNLPPPKSDFSSKNIPESDVRVSVEKRAWEYRVY